jgi:hypothetical protein
MHMDSPFFVRGGDSDTSQIINDNPFEWNLLAYIVLFIETNYLIIN